MPRPACPAELNAPRAKYPVVLHASEACFQAVPSVADATLARRAGEPRTRRDPTLLAHEGPSTTELTGFVSFQTQFEMVRILASWTR